MVRQFLAIWDAVAVRGCRDSRVDGAWLDPIVRGSATYTFELQTPTADVRIVSRSCVPAEHGLARDTRALSVALRRIDLRQGDRCEVVDAADARLGQGFRTFEPDISVRWTDGDAVLPTILFDSFDGPLHIGGTTRYPLYLDVDVAA